MVLAGGGHSHLAVLDDWSRNPPPGTELILITPVRHMTYSGMLPGYIEGLYERHELEIDLAPLAQAAGARLLLDEIGALDPHSKLLSLTSGATVEYDFLSLATGGSRDLTRFAAIEGLVPVRPIDRFLADWENMKIQLAQDRVSRIAVVGGGAGGTELALAISASLETLSSRALVALVAGRDGLLNGHALAVRERARTALSARNIDTLEANAEGSRNGLSLSDGRHLQVDKVIVATGSTPPAWLADSGLALGPAGGVAVGPDMRSVSHSEVFAAGDVSERLDRKLARSGVHAVKAGPVLAANLRSAILGNKLRPCNPPKRNLYLLATGEQHALLSWGMLAVQGRWVWRLKDQIDRRFVSRFQNAATRPARQSRSGGLFRTMFSNPVMRTALKVALVVGTALNAINQGDELLNGEPLSWGRIVMNYAVPFLVASYSGARAREAPPGSEPMSRDDSSRGPAS